MDAGASFDDPRLATFSILERACSVLSMIGSVFVITTFSYSDLFHKPINRLVFYATIGNLMANVGTLMSTAFTHAPNSPGCQAQAFLLQMFTYANALWMLSMAMNVYLTFYFSFDARRLRKMEIPYLLCCYGIPFTIALTLVFIETPERGRMYGSAKLWCWITPQWDYFRVALFYGPIWVVILITFAIYIRAGREIYNKHKQMKKFRFSTSSLGSEHSPGGVDDPFSSVKTTEVHITSEMADGSKPIDLISPKGSSTTAIGGGNAEHHPLQTMTLPQKPPPTAYSVAVSSHNGHKHSRHASREDTIGAVTTSGLPPTANITTTTTDATTTNQLSQAATPPEHGLAPTPTYTTVGSSTLRDSRTNLAPDASRRNNSVATTTGTAGHQTLTSHTCTYASRASSNPRRRAAYQASKAIWSYTKCALLFFTALCVTWIPSSANRVCSLAHGGRFLPALEYVAAIVLPLQGFWNAIIYVTTSWGACKILWEDLSEKARRAWWRLGGMVGGGRGGGRA
ncbi:hypothetical protein VTJ83DRAFT_3379 [Remersonia thermophila]|uniref:G-protein coupled receptors family 2 profile 2 domain-containing protein n=1 Tax=Remersonia thermophila TaxID=72144 RepID=A0ABR4DDU8_9PEZI